MKVIVFDDDPTGSQTVHNCPLLLKFDELSLFNLIVNNTPLLFLLCNTRSMPSDIAEAKIRSICRSIKRVLTQNSISLNDVLFISRGDSTLRGHLILEPELLHQELGPFDATFHVPAFVECGRITVKGIHYLNDVPINKTIFAKDKIFGFSNSFLPDLIEEKSSGQIKSKDVDLITLNQLDIARGSQAGMESLVNYLLKLSSNKIVVVDAKTTNDLVVFSSAIRIVGCRKRFLFRSAASLINALANIPYKKFDTDYFTSLKLRNELGRFMPGLIVVGSHVKLADEQLKSLLLDSNCIGLEVSVESVYKLMLNQDDELRLDFESDLINKLNNILDLEKTPVLYTSRGEFNCSSSIQRLEFGYYLSSLIARLVKNIRYRLGYIISKGGITTHILLVEALDLRSVHLLGQIIPGLSVVCSEEYCQKNSLPILTFPGNLGDKNTLLGVWEMMEKYH